MAKFTSENQPAKRGRPKGRKNNRTLALQDNPHAEDLTKRSLLNIKQAIEKGNLPTSRWFIERSDRMQAERLRANLFLPLVQSLGGIDSVDDLERISKHALLLMVKGEMTFDQLKYVQEALARHTVLKGTIEIAELRAQLEELQKDVGGGKLVDMTDHYPSWGKLREVTDQPQSDGGDGDGLKEASG